jgi:tocopherol cyclase
MNLHTRYHPEIFQGNLQNNNYFEGWYFKQVTADFTGVLSVIPGVSLASDRHAFIQVINGITGATNYIEYPLTAFEADPKKLIIRIGDSSFTAGGIDLRIDEPGLRLNGKLEFRHPVTWPRRLWAPGIMGWYSFVPRMECYHAVVSLDHSITGRLDYQGEQMNFDQGRGYIEKDWGTSMPESWIWLHANTFENPGTSVMLSIAKIPWRKSFFTGFIAFVLHEKRIYRFATYNNSRIGEFSLHGQDLEVTLENRNFSLMIRAHQKTAGKLKAPVKGLMERYIKESVDSDVDIRLLNRSGSTIFAGKARRSGLELVGRPENLLRRPEK